MELLVMTNRIHRLPDDIINKIAAGEVVERPASIVKELVENAFDAEARSVRVEIEAGGKSRIRVRDDGHGMGREDAEAALLRHATSKLQAFEDLQRIATHGFRGEALPSIASVSDLTLTTCEEGAAAGTEVRVRHGEHLHVRDAGHPRGTTVEVADLFGGVPARRKFLRGDTTEATHVAEALTLLALVRPGVRVTFLSGGRSVIDVPPADNHEARLYQLFGAGLLDGLVPVDGGADWARVSGFTSRPGRSGGGSRPSVRLFVNGRSVRDRALQKAVSEAYRAAGAAGHQPEAFLFVEVPPHMVDVNVHPAKTEVRFADPRTVFVAVEHAVREAISRGAQGRAPRVTASGDGVSRVQEAVQTYLERIGAEARHREEPHRSSGDDAIRYRIASPASIADGLAMTAETDGDVDVDVHVNGGSPLTVLGQHRDIYIVATDGTDLILIDQHTAHERVRFEALLARAALRTAESQRLLLPVVATVPPSLRPQLEQQAEALALLGYEVEPFGGDSVRIAAVPALLRPDEPGAALIAILKDLAEREEATFRAASARDRLAATLACHSAVRAGQRLKPETMAAIARDLAQTKHPDLCPHGRPTRVRIEQDEVSRWFGRTGWKRR
jgi:DNA mismatch repair protein MutL